MRPAAVPGGKVGSRPARRVRNGWRRPARADPAAFAPDRDGQRQRRPGLVLRDADGVVSVISFTVDGGRIAAIDVVRNPDKLTGVREPG